MQKLYALLSCVVLALFLNAQNVYTDRRDGEIYLKLKNDFKLNIAHDDAGYFSPEQLEFLQPFTVKFGVNSVQRSFYFAKEVELKQTLRIYFQQAKDIDRFIEELQQLPFVDYAEHVPLLKHGYTPNDLGTNSFNNGRWHLYRISAREAWDISRGNTNIKVAIVDDAVQTDHPDLAANMLPGRDVASGTNNPNPPSTSFSHGTHVAGCASAVTDNNVGVASIGFSVKIIPVKASNSATSISHGYEGITWASNNGANVINMSWGSTFGGNTGANVVNAAFNSGKTLVAAAGNSNNTTTFFPAGYTNVIAVASTTNTDAKSSFSNYGNWITVSAPGSNLRSPVPTNSYATQSGTSMASPVAAGLCGLILSVNPAFTPTQVRNCLVSTADNINSANPNFVGQLGSGRINAYQALLCAQGSVVQFDAGISRINVPSGSSCSNTFTPQVVLKNFGSSTLTSATIQFRIDNGTVSTFNWTGSLASQAETTVNLPSQTTTTGAHTFTANTTATLNGNQTDANANNNSTTVNFTIFGAPGLPLPFSESFESGSFATNNWTIENPDNGLTWELFTTAGTTPGNRSVRLPFYSYQTTGQRDGLITPPLNFTGFDTIKLRFEHAYRRYNQNSTDSLIIYVSTNCGSTWTRIFARGENGNGVFATAATSTADFVPAQASDWCVAGTVGSQCFELNLNAYKGNNAVRIKFEGFNNYQNNLYLDNINILGVQAGSPPVAQFTANPQSVCSGQFVSFVDQSTNQPNAYAWSFPGGNPSTSTQPNPSVRYDAPGTYDVSLTVTNANGNNTNAKTGYITVHPKPNVSGTYTPQQVCDGDEVTLIASGATDYTWQSGLSTFSGNNVEVSIFGNTVYELIGVDDNGCSDTVTVNVNASPKPLAGVTSNRTICTGETIALNASGGTSYNWSTGETGNFIFITPAQTTTYTVTVSLPGSACTDSASVTITVAPEIITQITDSSCGSYIFNGTTYIVSGVYTDGVYTATGGCDSTVILNLTIKTPAATSLTESVCKGKTFNFNGQAITQDGSYSATLTATNGCDSVVALNINFFDIPKLAQTGSICFGETFDFYGQNLTQSGVYTQTFTTAEGCDSVVELLLAVEEEITPSTIFSNGELSVNLPFESYQWFLNGQPVQGATGSTFTPAQSGSYSVVVTDVSGCSATSSSIQVNISSLESVAAPVGVKLYPNPADGFVVLEVEGAPAAEVLIFDNTGKLVLQTQTTESLNRIDVSKLAKAVYWVEWRSSTNAYRVRFTKL